MAELVQSPVRVRAPATSANLGPGYDSFGLSLAMYDEVEAAVVGSGLDVAIEGEGAAELSTDEAHLVVRAMRAAFEALDADPPGLRLRCVNALPHARGLGSSSAAIVTGIRLAEALTVGARLNDDAALGLAARLEGHPDNVAACLLGGLTIAWETPDGPTAARFDVDADVVPVAFI
ncbi:MAG: homoserine kinase, partial [Nocardioidaceae bacterium]